MSLNLIIDGNYFFYKTLFVFTGYSKGKVLESQKDQEMFVRKIATDLSHSIRTFGNPSKIVFTIDSKSWRKEIEIEDGGYKENRSKDESAIDWDAFYKCMNEFGTVLEKKGFIVSREERAEGDDLMHLWSERFFNNQEDSIIITGDKDLTQCVKYNDHNFIIAFNPNSKNRKIVAPIGFEKWLNREDINLFDASTFMNRSKDIIADALNAIPIEEIDPKYIIFEKVITGDAGDNVPPIWTWENKGKTFRITASKAIRMFELLNKVKYVDDVYDLPNRSIEISNSINSVCKQVAPSDAIQKRLTRNLQLVFLDNRIIPVEIQNAFNKSFAESEHKNLAAGNYDMNTLLEGTRFISGGRTFEADIFSAFS